MAPPDRAFAEERQLLEQALRAAAPAAMAAFRPGAEADTRSWRKADGSSVTEADLAANAALKEALLGARPGYGWLSEEEPETADMAALRAERPRAFVVDPIDGTRSFMEGSDVFCLSAALVADGRPVAAAVYAPAQDALYAASLGEGAHLNGAPLAARRPAPSDPPRVMAPQRDLAAKRWGAGGPPPVERGYLQPIAHRLCAVAAGAWDGLIALKSTQEWDLAAAVLIASEAGLLVTDRRGQALGFNKRDPAVDGVLAAPRALLEDWLAREPTW